MNQKLPNVARNEQWEMLYQSLFWATWIPFRYSKWMNMTKETDHALAESMKNNLRSYLTNHPTIHKKYD